MHWLRSGGSILGLLFRLTGYSGADFDILILSKLIFQIYIFTLLSGARSYVAYVSLLEYVSTLLKTIFYWHS